jgi:hypothetical protein
MKYCDEKYRFIRHFYIFLFCFFLYRGRDWAQPCSKANLNIPSISSEAILGYVFPQNCNGISVLINSQGSSILHVPSRPLSGSTFWCIIPLVLCIWNLLQDVNQYCQIKRKVKQRKETANTSVHDVITKYPVWIFLFILTSASFMLSHSY